MPYYHVQIGRKNVERSSFEMDLSEKKLQEYIIEPYHKGKIFFCGGVKINPFDVEYIRISKTGKSFKELKPIVEKRDDFAYMVGAKFYVVDEAENVTREFIKHPPKKEVKKSDRVLKSLSENIFIVHGSDEKPALELARIVEKDLGLNSIILHEKPDKGRTIIEKLEDESLEVGYAFVILTPDDVGNLIERFNEGKVMYRARQNVVLEFGYFMGLLGRNRVCCLHTGDIELPSDMKGIIYKPFKDSIKECFHDIVKELKAAGYEIKI